MSLGECGPGGDTGFTEQAKVEHSSKQTHCELGSAEHFKLMSHKQPRVKSVG